VEDDHLIDKLTNGKEAGGRGGLLERYIRNVCHRAIEQRVADVNNCLLLWPGFGLEPHSYEATLRRNQMAD